MDVGGDENLDLAENIAPEEDDDNEDENAKILQEVFPERQIIESAIDSKDWILECERVASKLKITV